MHCLLMRERTVPRFQKSEFRSVGRIPGVYTMNMQSLPDREV